MGKRKVLVGETRVVVSHAPYIHVGARAWRDAEKRIQAPTVIDSLARLKRVSRTLADPSIPARCYEAVFQGKEPMYGAPIYEAVRRLRVSAKDMAEVPAGTAPDYDDLIRFLSGETETLDVRGEEPSPPP
jgi:hypothetical protein